MSDNKTPLSYYGGKQKMASKIIPLIPKHTVYVEPFCGGAAILFAKGRPEISNSSHYSEVINDLESDVFNFWEQYRKNGEALVTAIEDSLYSREAYRQAKIRTDGCGIERARKFYVSCSQSFAKKLDQGFGTSVLRNHTATFENIKALIRSNMRRFLEVCVENLDALDLIKKYDSPQTFFYCDPPYPNSRCDIKGSKYESYTIDDLQKLVNTLDKIQGSFLLSNYPQSAIEFPVDWENFEFIQTMSAGGRSGKGKASAVDMSKFNLNKKECVWRKFSTIPRPEIRKIYQRPEFQRFVRHPWEGSPLTLF